MNPEFYYRESLDKFESIRVWEAQEEVDNHESARRIRAAQE